MADQFDVTLEDGDLLTEVELTTNLIIAASNSDERLSIEEIQSTADGVRVGSGGETAEIFPEAADHIFVKKL